jgi:hypothetical protein
MSSGSHLGAGTNLLVTNSLRSAPVYVQDVLLIVLGSGNLFSRQVLW